MMKKIFCLFFVVSMLITALTACSGSNEGFMGQVKSVNGTQITLEIGTANDQGKPQGTPPAGMEPPAGNRPDGQNQPPQGTPPNGMDGKDNPGAPSEGGMGRGGLTLTGEEKVVTISSDTKVTVENMGQSAEGTMEDIVVGSTVSVEFSDGKVISVVVRKQSSPWGGV